MGSSWSPSFHLSSSTKKLTDSVNLIIKLMASFEIHALTNPSNLSESANNSSTLCWPFLNTHICFTKSARQRTSITYIRGEIFTFQPAILVVDSFPQFPLEVAAECFMTSSIARVPNWSRRYPWIIPGVARGSGKFCSGGVRSIPGPALRGLRSSDIRGIY